MNVRLTGFAQTVLVTLGIMFSPAGLLRAQQTPGSRCDFEEKYQLPPRLINRMCEVPESREQLVEGARDRIARYA